MEESVKLILAANSLIEKLSNQIKDSQEVNIFTKSDNSLKPSDLVQITSSPQN